MIDSTLQTIWDYLDIPNKENESLLKVAEEGYGILPQEIEFVN